MSSNDDPVILFLCLLAVLCQVFLVVVLAFSVASGFSPVARVQRNGIFRALRPLAAPFAFCVAAVTMGGSLYLSEVKHYVPCHLCWIQRALLYPQVLFAGVLTFKPSLQWVRRLAIGALFIDVPVSTYHYFLQKYPSLETSSCAFDNPCTQRFIDRFHYLSEPFLALTAALTIMTLLLIQKGISAMEVAVWSVTALLTLAILLWFSSDAWAIAPLPLIVFAVLTVLERKSERTMK